MTRADALRAKAIAGQLPGIGGAAVARPTRALETIHAGVTVVEMQDADPLASMGLSRLQVDVAAYLRDLWRDALPGMDLPSSYGTGAGHGGKRHLTHDQHLAATRAWQDYRKAMDCLPHAVAVAVRAACIADEPAHAGLVRDGLTALGRHWRMK